MTTTPDFRFLHRTAACAEQTMRMSSAMSRTHRCMVGVSVDSAGELSDGASGARVNSVTLGALGSLDADSQVGSSRGYDLGDARRRVRPPSTKGEGGDGAVVVGVSPERRKP